MNEEHQDRHPHDLSHLRSTSQIGRYGPGICVGILVTVMAIAALYIATGSWRTVIVISAAALIMGSVVLILIREGKRANEETRNEER